MDDLFFSRNMLVDFASGFVKKGGKYLSLIENAFIAADKIEFAWENKIP